MTKAFLQRERAELKAAITQAHRLATAHRRRGSEDAKELLADLQAIESLAFAQIVASALREGSDKA